jgi:flagellar L-ring protein precursor FlgH
MRLSLTVFLLLTGLPASTVLSQSSSLLWQQPQPGTNGTPGIMPGRQPVGGDEYSVLPPEDQTSPATRTIESVSWIAVPAKQARKFKVNDFITIIVRQQKRYKGEQEYEKEKKWDISGRLEEWFRFYPDHRLGTDNLSNGEPGFDFRFNDKYEAEGEAERKDQFTTRITAEVIDVRPNGNLVLQASTGEQHDSDGYKMTLTGMCRSEDVTPDNTVLSTQIARLEIKVENRGAVKDASSRGWFPRILDFLKPF